MTHYAVDNFNTIFLKCGAAHQKGDLTGEANFEFLYLMY